MNVNVKNQDRLNLPIESLVQIIKIGQEAKQKLSEWITEYYLKYAKPYHYCQDITITPYSNKKTMVYFSTAPSSGGGIYGTPRIGIELEDIVDLDKLVALGKQHKDENDKKEREWLEKTKIVKQYAEEIGLGEINVSKGGNMHTYLTASNLKYWR